MRKTLLSLLVVILSVVLPTNAAVQYCLSPEGFESGSIPTGWTQDNVNGTESWAVEGGTLTNPTGAKSGSYRAAIHNSSVDFTTKLITPAVNLTSAYIPQLIFSHAQVARGSYSDTLRVYYRLNATAAWTLLAEYLNPVNGWTTETITLPSNYQQGTAYQIAFEAKSGSSPNGVVLDDVCIVPTSQCQDAYIQGISATSNSVTVSFGCNGQYENFEVVLSESPITNWTNVDLNTLPFHQVTDDYEITATGLQANTTYYAYVRTDCDDNVSGYTNWVSASVKTPLKVALPYTQNFNTVQNFTGTTQYGLPQGWTYGNNLDGDITVPFVYSGTTASIKQTYSVDSTAFLAIAGSLSTSPSALAAGEAYAYVATPELEGNLTACEVSFWGTVGANYYYSGATSYAAEITVGVMTDPNDLGTFTAIETVKCDYANQFKFFQVSLAGYTGQGKFVAFLSQSAKANAFFLDNLEIKPVNTAAPSALKISNVLPTGFRVSANLHGADSWNLMVANAYMRNPANLPAANVLLTQNGISASSFDVNLSSLAGQTVVVYVQTVKNGVASAWSFPQTLRIPAVGTAPVYQSFNTGYTQLTLKELINEIHSNPSNKGVAELYSPMKSLSLYPSVVSTTPNFEGSHLVLNGVDNYFFLPYLDNINTLEVNFRLSSGTSADQGRVAVGVMTDPYDLSTFVELGRFDGTQSSYAKCRQTLDSYTGQGHYIAIRALSPVAPSTTYGSVNCIDELRVRTIFNCYDATNIKAVATSASATISWNPGGMQQFLLKVYSNAAHTELVASELKSCAATDTLCSHNLTGLASSTQYYYSLQTVCGADTLPIEDYYSFVTSAGIPFSENFNGITSGIPAGWDNSEGSVTTATFRWNYHSVGQTGACVRFNSYSASTGQDNYLATPSLALEGVDAVRMTFAYKNPAGGDFEVLIAVDGDSVRTPLLQNLTGQTTWETKTVNLTQYVGHSVVIYFHATSNYGYGDAYVYLDEVKVEGLDANCQGITLLNASATGSSTADINWAVGGTHEAHLTITAEGASTPLFDGVVTASPYQLTGLTPNTQYNVVGYQPCKEEDTMSASFRTDCAPFAIAELGTIDFAVDGVLNCWHVGVADTAGVGTTSITIPSVVNKSGYGKVLSLEKKKNTTNYNYGNNYYAIMPALTIDSIQKYQVVFDAATTVGSSDTANVHKLYIGVITDPSDFSTVEWTDTINLSYCRDSSSLKTYSIGFDNYMGDYMGDNGSYVIFQVSAPEGYSDEAIIDNVRLESVSGCHQIIDLEATKTTSNGVVLQWTGNAAAYQLAIADTLYRVMPQNPVFVYTNTLTATRDSISTLNSNVPYYAYIRAICAVGDTSVWSSATAFRTECGAITEFPWTEDFNSRTTGNIAFDCWINEHIEGSATNVLQVSSTNQGDNNTNKLYLADQQVGNRTLLQLPLMHIPAANAYEFRMDMYRTSSYLTKQNEGFLILCQSDFGTDTLALVPRSIAITNKYVDAVSDAGWYTYSFNIPASGDIHIELIGISEYGNASYADNLEVRLLPTCPAPKKVSVKDVTCTSATLSWNSEVDNYIVEVSESASFVSLVDSIAVSDTTLVLNNLVQATTYYARVRRNCEGSEWSGTVSFGTMMGLDFVEDFNAATSIPAGWSQGYGDLFGGQVSSSTSSWYVTASAGGGMASNHAYAYAYHSSTGTLYSRILATPLIMMNNKQGNNIKLSYKLALTGGSTSTTAPTADMTGHSFHVAITTDQGATWTPIQSMIDTAFVAIPATAKTYELDLTQYDGQQIALAFYHAVDSSSTSSTSIYTLLDDVKLQSVNVSCLAPQLQFVSATTNSASFAWAAEAGKSYVVQVAPTATFASVDSVVVADSVATVTGLNSSSIYYARVKVLCGAGVESSWSEAISFNTACEAITAFPWSDDFENYASGDMTNPCWVNEHLEGNGTKLFGIYTTAQGGNSTKKLYLPDMANGTRTLLALPEMQFDGNTNYRFTLSVYRNATSYATEGIRIFVGENAAVDATATELGFISRNYSIADGDNVPAEATSGWYTYEFNIRKNGVARVILRGESAYGSATYMDNFSVEPIAATLTLREAAINQVTRTSMNVTWTPQDTTVCTNAQMVVSTTPLDAAALATAEKITVTDSMHYTVKNLDRETTYYVYVRTVCNGVEGDWVSASATTKALLGCDNIIIANGTATNDFVPVYGFYCDEQQKTQSIYPASMLTDILGQSISQLKYSVSSGSNAGTWDNSTFIVRMGVTSATDLSSGFTTATLTQVYSGYLTANTTDGMVVNLTTPFVYNGGNLLIEFEQPTASGYSSVSFEGVSAPAGSSRYEYNGYSGWSGAAQSFLPKLDFTNCYALDPCQSVTAASAELLGLGTSEVKLSWVASDADYVGSYDVFYATTDTLSAGNIVPQFTGVDSLNVTITGLTEATQYYAYIRAICNANGHDDGSSQWFVYPFATNASCMPVVDLVATVTGKHTAEATWTKQIEDQDNAFRYVLSTSALDSAALAAATLVADTTAHIYLDNLQSDQEYHLYVAAACGQAHSPFVHTTFTMPSTCPAVADFAASRIAQSAVTLSWTHGAFGEENFWEVGIVGDNSFTQQIADTSVIFFGLAPDSAYTAYVKAICAEGDTSAISFATFRTTPVPTNACVVSGNGTAYNNVGPFNNYYKNSWNQMIYTADQIGQAGTINSISFDCAQAAALNADQITIYLANTDKTVAANSSDWVAASDLVEVYSITNYDHTSSTGWVDFPLTVPFEYEGGNLAVVVSHASQSYANGLTWTYSNKTNGVILYRRSDSDASCAAYPTTSGTMSTQQPDAQFCFDISSCPKVKNLEALNITTNSADVRWYPGGSESSWATVISTTELSGALLATAQQDTVSTIMAHLTGLALDQDYYFYVRGLCSATDQADWVMLHFITEADCRAPVSVVADEIGTTTANLRWTTRNESAQAYEVAYAPSASFNLNAANGYTVVSTTVPSVQLTGLLSNVDYTVAVRTICSATETSRWCDPFEFTTDCGTVSLPWGENFDDRATGDFSEACWINEHVAGTGTYLFSVSTNTDAANGTKVLTLRDQAVGNITNLVLPKMHLSAPNATEFSLDVKRTPYSSIKNSEGLHIYVSQTDTLDATAQLLAFIPRENTIDGTNVAAEDAAGWYSYSFILPQQGDVHIIIQGVSEYGNATYFDNLLVQSFDINCGGVTNLAVSNVTTTTASASWNTIGSETVRVSISDANEQEVFATTTTADSIQITNLVAGESYTLLVTQVCGGRFARASFRTSYTVPFVSAFNETESPWAQQSVTSGSWGLSSDAKFHLGQMADTVACFNIYSTYSARLISPELYVPVLNAGESLMLSCDMATLPYSSSTEPGADDEVRIEVSVDGGNWQTVKSYTFDGGVLTDGTQAIPWNNADHFTYNFDQFAGHSIRFAFFGGSTESNADIYYAVDNVALRAIRNYTYQASTCSSSPYQDDYFSFEMTDLVVGTTEYQKLVPGQNGAVDTLVVLQLTVNAAVEADIYDSICEGHVYSSYGVTPFIAKNNVTKPLFLTATNGCDSIVNVHIAVIPAVKVDTTVLACKGSGCIVNGNTYYTSTVVTDTLQGVNTCDSIVRTFIYFSDESSYNVDQHRVICAGDTYTDKAFPNGISAAGTYTSTVTSEYGCDSTVTVHAIIANNKVAYDTIMVEDLPYVYAEEELLGTNVPAGTYKHSVQATCGAVELNITVVDKTALDNVSALSLSVAPNPAAVGEPVQILTALTFSADFRLTVFDAVGQLVMTSEEQTLTVPGMPVAGFYTVRVTNGGKTYQAKLLVK